MDTETFKRSRFLERLGFFVLGVLACLAVQYFVGTAGAQTLNNSAVSGSASNSDATSASQSGSVANSNQSLTSNLGASQGNAQNITFNSQQHERTKVDTNTAVPLAAAVSFSSDYCGGVGSAGASAAGISIGVAKPILDGNCQSLRRAEKFGMMAVTAKNMGANTQAARLLAMSIWELCTAEANSNHSPSNRKGETGVPSSQAGCLYLGLVKPDAMDSGPAMPAEEVQQRAEKAKVDSQQGMIDATAKANATAPPLAWRPLP